MTGDKRLLVCRPWWAFGTRIVHLQVKRWWGWHTVVTLVALLVEKYTMEELEQYMEAIRENNPDCITRICRKMRERLKQTF